MRIRTIKPEFYKHDGLAELPPLTRILFTGLWCMADRRGRLADRPPRIKIEVLPYDECDVDEALNDLHSAGMIQRYQAEGINLIQITNFEKHQRINGKEAEQESDFPPPSEGETGLNLGSAGEATGKQPGSQEGKGKEKNGREHDHPPAPKGERDRPNRISQDQILDIYAAYPRKVGKDAALKAIAKATREITPADLLAKTQAYAAAVATWPAEDRQYIPHPATWFNRGSYEDDPAEWQRTTPANTARAEPTPEGTAAPSRLYTQHPEPECDWRNHPAIVALYDGGFAGDVEWKKLPMEGQIEIIEALETNATNETADLTGPSPPEPGCRGDSGENIAEIRGELLSGNQPRVDAATVERPEPDTNPIDGQPGLAEYEDAQDHER